MELNKLIDIEEKLERSFIALANLESQGLQLSLEYEEIFKVVYDLVNEEKRLLGFLSNEDIMKLRKMTSKYCNKSKGTLALGYMINTNYERLLNILNKLIGSELYDYALYLRYDLNQLIFSFLEYLINDEVYEDIKKDLIFYKYNLIYMNYLSEEDFLQTRDLRTIRIESKSYKNNFNPELIFVDKSMLILEGREYVDFIEEFGEDFKENSNHFTLVVISVLELIARLVLSEDEILQYLQQDFNYLLESDGVPLEVKNLVQDMLLVLEKLKAHINLAR